MSFSQRLREVIGGSTIEEFAALLGESPQRVKDVLREKQKPPADFLINLQLKTGVDLNWLLVGGGTMPPLTLSARESALIDNYRAAADEGRKAIEQTSSAVAKREAAPAVKRKAA